jgi:hypothetical protein
MKPDLRVLPAAALSLPALHADPRGAAQKAGGILQMLDFASPASTSIHEESSNTPEGSVMGVFNNLVLYD